MSTRRALRHLSTATATTESQSRRGRRGSRRPGGCRSPQHQFGIAWHRPTARRRVPCASASPSPAPLRPLRLCDCAVGCSSIAAALAGTAGCPSAV